MAVSSRRFPNIPLDANKLAENLKLYSDDVIQDIKSHLTENGSYDEYDDANGDTQELEYPVYVHNGKYFAVIPDNTLITGDNTSSFGDIWLAQDLDSGEWVVDKSIIVNAGNGFTDPDVENEKYCLQDSNQAILDDEGDVVSFHEEDNVYDIFMQFATGMSLQTWLDQHPDLSPLIKMEMSLALVRAVQSLHDRNLLHRDIKLQNAVYNLLRSPKHAVNLVDFGLAVHMDQLDDGLSAGWGTPGYMAPEICETERSEIGTYSTRSDIYALGVTLGRIWNYINVEEGEVSFNKEADFGGFDALKHDLKTLIRNMMDEDYLERPDLTVVTVRLRKMLALMPPLSRMLNVGFLDANQLLAASKNQAAFKELLAELHGFDQIRLYQTDDVCKDRAILIGMQALRNAGCVVSDKVYAGDAKQIEKYVMLRNESQKNAKLIGRIYHMQIVSTDKPKHEEVARLRMTDDVEEYDLADCTSWFFGSLRDDACDAVATAVPEVPECSAGCFGFFSQPRMPTFTHNVNPLYEPGSRADVDSDSEESNNPVAMARYCYNW